MQTPVKEPFRLGKRDIPTRAHLPITAEGTRKVFAIIVRVVLYLAVFGPIAANLLALAVLGPAELKRIVNEQVITAAQLWWNSGLQFAFFALLPFLDAWITRPGDHPLRQFGLPPTRSAFPYSVLGAGLGVLLLLVMILISPILDWLEPSTGVEEQMADIVTANPALIFVIPVVAGIGEEIVFRGFLLPRYGLTLSSFAFGLAHMGYGSVVHVAVSTAAGFAFGGMYRATGLLWVPMVAHIAYDLVLFIAIALA